MGGREEEERKGREEKKGRKEGRNERMFEGRKEPL